MKDPIDKLFEDLKSDFNKSEPNIGHFERFEAKLAANNEPASVKSKSIWPVLAIAASLLILLGFGYKHAFSPQSGLASVSPEMSETQHYFVSMIEGELEKIAGARTAENDEMIQDALIHIQKLDREFDMLEKELYDSGKDKRIIHAMINNFQKRIEILQTLIHQLEEIKNQKNNSKHENNLV